MYYTGETAELKEYFSKEIPKIIKKTMPVEKISFIHDAFHPNTIWLKISFTPESIPFDWNLKFTNSITSSYYFEEKPYMNRLYIFEYREFEQETALIEEAIKQEILEILKTILE